ncbi:nicotinate-nucleotide--dimethylbenzimidazole phosphoribosyltransferase [Kineococcus sp. SYSU DK006]|uniref:nicotinate-nucleotide--dimethylbenzimidazole phosphoribosyltransferase n=1 Tax=Kineococcus sp. SYSU DK006 TaxID=3383127 RepID=UPI003D7D9854
MTDGPRPLNLREIAEGLRSPHTSTARPRTVAPLLPASRADQLARWLAGTQDRDVPAPLERVQLVVFAGDHGVAARGTSRLEAGWTARAVRELVGGRGALAALAASVGVPVAVHAVGVDWGGGVPQDVPAAVTAHALRAGSGDIAVEDALSAEEVEAAVRAGAAVADAAVDAGVDLLLLSLLGAGATTVGATLVATCLRKGAVDVVGRGSGVDDDAWMRKTAAVRDAVRRARKLATRPTAVLQAVASADTAAAVGFLLRAAARRTPVLLDGLSAVAAALLAARAVPGTEKWWQVAAATAEPAQALAADRLKLVPLVDLGAGRGDGTGALSALGLLRAAQVLAAADEAALPPLPEPEPEAEPEPAPEAEPEPGVGPEQEPEAAAPPGGAAAQPAAAGPDLPVTSGATAASAPGGAGSERPNT